MQNICMLPLEGTNMNFLWALSLATIGIVYGQDCGIPAIPPVVSNLQRIINGEEAVPGSWPWQVSLQYNGNHYCAGSIINENWILTAAHCDPWPGIDFIVMGEHDRLSDEEQLQTIGIIEVFIHPEWNELGSTDVALVKLASPIQFNDRVSPVCLATVDNFPEGTKLVTTGWGRDNLDSYESAVRLQQVSLPLVSEGACKAQWGELVNESMICGGAAGASSCHGDSGGPLVIKVGRVWYQVGIVSWGSSACDVTLPAVYSRITYALGWIEEIVAAN
ncbi:chymotrypsinogen B-like [Rhinatrema bivittatum]|uniref:chymotrypsinogen B-like n=1 Tax=Rhinatrema bivittatum TaxID=194408 RepID=UPI001129EBF0|nr:chymotrypsinogen B-like [Rhinatrema bivittatum]